MLPQPKKQKMAYEDRHCAILKGAARAFVEHGYEATSLEEIALAAHVSRALLYRHFISKHELYVMILVTIRGQLSPIGLVEGPISEAALAGQLRQLITIVQDNPDGFRLFLRHAIREPAFREYVEELNTKSRDYIAKNLQVFIADPKEREFTAVLLRDTIYSILLTWTDYGLPVPEQILPLLRRVIGGILGVGE